MDEEDRFRGDWINFPALYEQRKDAVGPECLTVAVLEAYLQRTIPQAQLQTAESHLQQCDRCSAELDYLRAFNADQPPADVPREDIAAIERKLQAQAKAFTAERFKNRTGAPDDVVAMPSPPRKRSYLMRRPHRLVAIAASMVLILAMAYYKMREPRLPHGPDSDSASVRGRHVSLVFPLGALSEAPRYLSWELIPGATRYTVRITEVDGVPVWSETVTTGKAPIPAGVAAELVRAKTYYWFVEAQSDAGTRACSDRGWFVIELPQKKSP